MFTPYFWKKCGLSFARAFIPAFILGVLPVWDAVAAGDWNAGKAALLALITGAGTAGIRALQALFTNLETDANN
jgi:hypothetical protein